jgi:glycolate oxidase iron-sulfur subunit
MRALIDAWWPHVEGAGVEAIVMSASGCGATVREYGHLLAHDPAYAAKAKKISELTKDLSEIVAAELDNLKPLLARTARGPGNSKLALQLPCTLQHGQKITGLIERILVAAGFELTPVADSHLCCGSAGTYSMLQPELSGRLKANKLAALHAGSPQAIVSANIGCLSHLQSGSALPMEHWIVALERRLAGA